MYGRRTGDGRRAGPGPAAAGLFLLLTPAVALAWSTADLLEALAAEAPEELVFEEIRDVELMQTRVRGEGVLSFEPPDTFIRELKRPRSERLIIEGDSVTLEEGGEVRHTFQYGDDAGVDAIILLMRALHGRADAEAMEETFRMRLEGDREAWRWILTPRAGGARQRIQRMTLYGAGSRVERSVLREGGGDRVESRYRRPE